MLKTRYVIVAKMNREESREFIFTTDCHELYIRDGRVVVTKEKECIFYAKEDVVLMVYEEPYIDMPGIVIDSKGIKYCTKGA